MAKFNEQIVRSALLKSWSLDTAKQWSKENPANGQCNVTAAVIYDLFGGEILRTPLSGGLYHYYNKIDGKIADLTDSQFDAPDARFPWPNPYEDLPTTIQAAMKGIPQREFDTLKTALLEKLKSD